MSITELVASLDAAEGLPLPVAREGDRFRVEDDVAAAWAMRRLASVRRRMRDVQVVADGEIERVQAWAAAQSEPLERDAAYFEGLLSEYARMVRDNPDDGRKTVSTPYGTVQTRAVKERMEVTDPAALLEWARAHHSGLVQVKYSVSAAAAANVLASEYDADGVVFDPVTADIVPGIVARPASVSVSFTVDKGIPDGAL